jgi:threonine/homoserine/homoserine lactone efflux protein
MLDLGLLVAAFTTIAATLLGLVAVYQQFGLAALWIAVGPLYLLYLGMQRRSSGYLDARDAFGNGPPRLPPPGKHRAPGRSVGQGRLSRVDPQILSTVSGS